MLVLLWCDNGLGICGVFVDVMFNLVVFVLVCWLRLMYRFWLRC